MEDAKTLANLFRQLNCRVPKPELRRKFFPFGKVAIEFLESCIDSPNATELQVVNAIDIMCLMRRATNQSRLFLRLLKLSKDPRKLVRSKAIASAVIWTNYAEQGSPGWIIPEAQRDLVMTWAKDSLALGLEENTARLVKEFIERKI